jgi:Xaa-Pro dipeptidase
MPAIFTSSWDRQKTGSRSAFEADFGRTFVLGYDPAKHKMQRDVGRAFAEGKEYFNGNPEITSSELFKYAESLAQKFGWLFGGPIAGHLIGQFPYCPCVGLLRGRINT